MQLGSRSAIEFIKKMRAHPKFYKIKFMVVSGCLTQDDTLALMRLGIRNILVKPFTARQILTNAISCLRIEKKPYKTVDRILEAVRDHFYEEESEDGFSDEELSDILDKSDSED